MFETKTVGKSVPRLDGPETVSGSALYTADYILPSCLHAKLFRSSVAHGKIRRLDVSRAENLKGVVSVVTAADLRGKRFGSAIRDEEVFAGTKVRFLGDAIAAVAAENEVTAEEALDLIECEYDELPAMVTTDEALRENAPLIHESCERYELNPIMARKWSPVPGTNIAHQTSFSRGNVDHGFADADEIFEDTFTTSQVQHCAIEPHATLARMETGRLTVWTTTQNVFQVRAELSHLFDLPEANIRVIGAKVGGGFGGKNVSLRIEPHVVALALKTGRPVKLILDRTEEFNSTAGSVPASIKVKTGVKKDGRITAKTVDFIWDTGAYAEGLSASNRALKDGIGPYRIANVRVTSTLVYTNKVRGCPFRGMGIAEAVWAGESQMDMIADRLGLDPVTLRSQNCLQTGDETPAGDRATNIALQECLEKVSAAVDWPRKSTAANRGIGFSLLLKSPTTSLTRSNANVRINRDGGIELLIGVSDVGGGAGTSLAQIAAEVLNIPVQKVKVSIADTDLTPFDHGTFSSRVIAYVGIAVKLAAEDAKRQILAAVAKSWSVPADALQTANGKVMINAKRTIGFDEIVDSLAPNGVILGQGAIEGKRHWAGDPDSEDGSLSDPGWPFGAQAVEVEVDRQTGVIKILRVVSAHDVGRAINPRAVEGQIEGGVIMGIGFALQEGFIFEEGRLANANFADYKIPTSRDIPKVLPIIVEKPYASEPFGAKGVGEVSLFGIAPAIANAVANATGVRIKDLPMTPEKILDQLKGMNSWPIQKKLN
jgi:CO/xanthine dehydrogenase Mo-binding subunit